MGHRTTAASTVARDTDERILSLERRLEALEGNDRLPAPQCTAGELLRRRRREVRHSQTLTGALLGVNQATISKWERGDRIGWDHVADVAEYLGLSPAALVALNF